MEFKVGDKVSFKDVEHEEGWMSGGDTVKEFREEIEKCGNVLEVTKQSNFGLYFGKELSGWGRFKQDLFELTEPKMEFKVGDRISFKDVRYRPKWCNTKMIKRFGDKLEDCGNVLIVKDKRKDGTMYFRKEFSGWGYFEQELFKLTEPKKVLKKKLVSYRNLLFDEVNVPNFTGIAPNNGNTETYARALKETKLTKKEGN